MFDWLREFFKPSYKLEIQSCPACVAHKMHIEDLQKLLGSERQSYAALQTILLTRLGVAGQEVIPEAEDNGPPKPLRSIQTTSQLRRAAVARERETHPNATADYWNKVKDDYEKAGKLPTVEVNG